MRSPNIKDFKEEKIFYSNHRSERTGRSIWNYYRKPDRTFKHNIIQLIQHTSRVEIGQWISENILFKIVRTSFLNFCMNIQWPLRNILLLRASNKTKHFWLRALFWSEFFFKFCFNYRNVQVFMKICGILQGPNFGFHEFCRLFISLNFIPTRKDVSEGMLI